MGKRSKTKKQFSVDIYPELVAQLNTLPARCFTAGFPDTRQATQYYRGALMAAFRKAGIKMTPHTFRHYRISEWLAHGVQVSDVSKWVGASETQIRKTYEHAIAEGETFRAARQLDADALIGVE